MNKNLLFLICIALGILLPWHAAETKISETDTLAKDHIIVKVKKLKDNIAASVPEYSENIITAIAASENLETKSVKKLYHSSCKNPALYNKYELGTYYLVFFAGETNLKDASKKFESDTRVDFAEPDFIGEAAGKKGTTSIPNDEFFNRQWGLHNDGNTRTTTGRIGKIGADINVTKAWDIETGSEEILIAILDSGVKTDHPDLIDRIWINKKETRNSRDDDNNGFVDDVYGYNFAYDNSNVKDDLGHGTNIAGTIGASTNNALGYSGVDQKCKL